MEGIEAALLPLGFLKLPYGCCAGDCESVLPAIYQACQALGETAYSSNTGAGPVS